MPKERACVALGISQETEPAFEAAPAPQEGGGEAAAEKATPREPAERGREVLTLLSPLFR